MENEKTVSKTTKRRTSYSWNAYIHKVLKQVHPDYQIKADAISQVDKFLQILAQELAKKARSGCLTTNRSTVGRDEIEMAVRLSLPGELQKHAIGEITKAITKFTSSKSAEKGTHERTKPVRREKTAGLQFSVTLAEKFIRDFGTSDLSVAQKASVALAAVCEYICAELMELSGNVASDNKKITISTRFIFLAVQNDEELRGMFNSMNIELMGSGVVPHIREDLIPTEEERKKQASARRKNRKTTSGGEVRKQKVLPGTKALREIKKMQKTTDVQMQTKPLEREIRRIALELNATRSYGLSKIHFKKGIIDVLQHFVEQRVVSLLRDSQDFASHAKHKGVSAADVELAWSKMERNIPREPLIEVTDEIGDNGIDRLATKAGVKRKAGDMHDVIRDFITNLLYCVINKTLIHIRYRKAVTIGANDVRVALRDMGYNFIIPSIKNKKKTHTEPNEAE